MNPKISLCLRHIDDNDGNEMIYITL